MAAYCLEGRMDGDDPLVAQCRTRVGRLISGKWRLDALIGVGGMAAVYMATHRNGNLAAVKILHEEVSLNQEVRERFLREAYIANKVNHPGTVKVLDDDRDELGAPYIVMELLTGQTVEGRAQKSGGRLSIEETLDILDRSLAVLEAAHGQAIVHRDLKPENLFLTDQGELKVLDFGIARLREENQQRRTQTGLVMGTPAFMAPEQAMGRWSDVDPRTDLWAIAATAFTLLTGLPVHDAETAGEMLIAAATRPARSLARVFPQAPFALVALLDRGLAYERDNRFPDARSFRAELAQVRSSLTADEAALSQRGTQKVVIPATVHGGTALPQPVLAAAFGSAGDEDDDERIETFDPSANSDDEIARLAKFFSLLERALTATKQYALDHPEPKRRFDEAFRELAAGLMTCDVALAWNLTPYSFGAREQIIWEPEAPWNRIPYQLFADGVRTMGFAPGLDLPEFMRWVRLITLDPTTDFAPEDDLVTLLWDESLEHVFFQAIDSFAEGNQDQRARYEAERAQVIAGAHIDHRAELKSALAAERKQRKAQDGADVASKGRELFRVMSRGDTTDAEAAARVANLNITDGASDAQATSALQIDGTTLALLSARMEVDISAVSERFITVATEAFVVSAQQGRSAAVTAPLRRAIDSLGSAAPVKAVEMILELRDAISVDGKELDTESLRQTMTSEILSASTLLAILQGGDALETEAARTEYLKALTRVLGCLQPQHFDAALSYLERAAPGELRQLILEYLKRTGRGHEAKVGALFAKVDVDLGLALVRLLSEIDSQQAKDAIGMASQSPHALVRIEALGHIEGASGTRLRQEIKKLLEDPDDQVRLAALQAMESHNITIAGAFVVLRIQQADFFKLPFAERRQALQTLNKLRSKRCEEVCIELLSESSLLRLRSRDETRELAAQFLGELASSDAALFLLEAIANSSGLRNSKRVRDAAQAALDRLKQRAEAITRKRAARNLQRSQPGVDVPSTPTAPGAPNARNRKRPPSVAQAPAATASHPVAQKPAANDNEKEPEALKASTGTARVVKTNPDEPAGGTTRHARSRT